METRDVQQALNDMGFDAGKTDGIEGAKTRTAVARFQLAYNRARLVVDAIAGPKTWAAITDAQSASGRISDHFRTSELRSKGDQTCFVHRDLLAGLERLRREVGKPLTIRSGWRDVRHNTTVGGARTSQHTYGAAPELTAIRVRLDPGTHLYAGRAADFDRGYVSLEDVRAMRIFSGVGYRKVDGINWVTHVDVRADRTPNNPSIWVYN